MSSYIGAPEDEPGYWDDKYPDDEEEDEGEDWTCAYPDKCLMPSDHTRDECHTVEDMEAYYAEIGLAPTP